MPSTVIKSFTYDSHSASLLITFVSGTVYEYMDVPEEIYNAMKNSKAKGIYYNLHIKKIFSFRKIN